MSRQGDEGTISPGANNMIKKYGVLIFAFTVSTGVAMSIYDKLTLPFSNPWNIIGPLATLKYNPHNDILRFLVFITIPSMVYIVFCFNKYIRAWFAADKSHGRSSGNIGKDNPLLKYIVWALVLSALLLAAGNTYRSQSLDTFHEGETLGPAIDYLNGKVPYRDTIFIHGVFHEPLRSVLAFKIFGQSIAAFRSLESLLAIITLALFFWTLYVLYSKDINYTAISFGLLMIVNYFRPFGAIFYVSYIEIPFLLVLICAIQIHNIIETNRIASCRKRLSILLFLFTLIPTASFANSIDRGFFLCTAAGLYSFAVYLLFLRKDGVKQILPLLGGFVLGVLLVGFAIKWSYYDFLKYVSVLLRYEPLMNGMVYPLDDVKFLSPVLLISIILYWLTYRIVKLTTEDERGFVKKARGAFLVYFMEILLLLFSVFYFRRVLGRADTAHLSGVIFPIAILTLYVLTKHYISPAMQRRRNGYRVISVVAVSVLMVFFVLKIPRVDWGRWYKLPLAVPDEEFIPQNYLETISYLRMNLNAEDEFLTLTSEASWYYFLNKPCPIRFAVIYQAMPPFYQTEIVDTLRKRNVKFVLYKNDHWANQMEGFALRERIPQVVKYVEDNFEFHRKIDDNEIWISKVG